ncbi:hypothetical protein ASZ90_004386 [hydrocarbon metagenome]|uniref:Uncharacterized protein n=1 Tax=hydrocarbon metagenome TaxID=938273 RepID=A0A0W8FYL8_9ZZZZ
MSNIKNAITDFIELSPRMNYLLLKFSFYMIFRLIKEQKVV